METKSVIGLGYIKISLCLWTRQKILTGFWFLIFGGLRLS